MKRLAKRRDRRGKQPPLHPSRLAGKRRIRLRTRTKVCLGLLILLLIALPVTYAWFTAHITLINGEVTTGSFEMKVWTAQADGELSEAVSATNGSGESAFQFANLQAGGTDTKYIAIENTGDLDFKAYILYSFLQDTATLDENLTNDCLFSVVDITRTVLNTYNGKLAEYAAANPTGTVDELEKAGGLNLGALETTMNTGGIYTKGSNTVDTPNVRYFRINFAVKESMSEDNMGKSIAFSPSVSAKQINAPDETDDTSGQIFTVDSVDTLRNALNNALPGDTIRLSANITYPNNTNLEFTKLVNLDLAGYTLTVNGYMKYTSKASGSCWLRTTGASKLVVAGYLLIDTPAANFTIEGSNNKEIVLGTKDGSGLKNDTGTLIVNTLRDDTGVNSGFVLTNMQMQNALGQAADIIVRSSTSVSVTSNSVTGLICAENGASNIRILNQGTVKQIDLSAMRRLAYGTEQVLVKNYGTFVNKLPAIVLPAWSIARRLPGANTRVINGKGAVVSYTVSGSDYFTNDDIESEGTSTDSVEEVIRGTSYIVNRKPSEGNTETVVSLLTEYFNANPIDGKTTAQAIAGITDLEINTYGGAMLGTNDFSEIRQDMKGTLSSLNMAGAQFDSNKVPVSALEYMTLSNIVIPDTIVEIGAEAFRGNALMEFTVPAGVTTIGKYALADQATTSLLVHWKPNQISLVENSSNWCTSSKTYFALSSGNYESVVKNSSYQGVTSSKDSWFYHVVPEGTQVVDVGSGTYYVTLLNQSLTIRAYIGQTTMSVPSQLSLNGQTYSVEAVGRFAYVNMPSSTTLDTLTFPDSCKSIGRGAFAGVAVYSVNLGGVETVEDYAFFHSSVFYTEQNSGTKTGTLTAPSLVTLGKYNFCTGGTPAQQKNVGYNLTEINCPKLETVGAYCFYRESYNWFNLKSLKTAYLPSLTTVGDYCFHNLITLELLDLRGASRTNITLGANTFNRTTSTTPVIMRCYANSDNVAYLQGLTDRVFSYRTVAADASDFEDELGNTYSATFNADGNGVVLTALEESADQVQCETVNGHEQYTVPTTLYRETDGTRTAYTVTGVGNCAYSRNPANTSTDANTMRSLICSFTIEGNYTFVCAPFNAYKLSGGDTALYFYNDPNITSLSVTGPSTVTTRVETDCFYNCPKLRTISIDGVSEVANSMSFTGNTSLISLTVKGSCTWSAKIDAVAKATKLEQVSFLPDDEGNANIHLSGIFANGGSDHKTIQLDTSGLCEISGDYTSSNNFVFGFPVVADTLDLSHVTGQIKKNVFPYSVTCNDLIVNGAWINSSTYYLFNGTITVTGGAVTVTGVSPNGALVKYFAQKSKWSAPVKLLLPDINMLDLDVSNWTLAAIVAPNLTELRSTLQNMTVPALAKSEAALEEPGGDTTIDLTDIALNARYVLSGTKGYTTLILKNTVQKIDYYALSNTNAAVVYWSGDASTLGTYGFNSGTIGTLYLEATGSVNGNLFTKINNSKLTIDKLVVRSNLRVNWAGQTINHVELESSSIASYAFQNANITESFEVMVEGGATVGSNAFNGATFGFTPDLTKLTPVSSATGVFQGATFNGTTPLALTDALTGGSNNFSATTFAVTPNFAKVTKIGASTFATTKFQDRATNVADLGGITFGTKAFNNASVNVKLNITSTSQIGDAVFYGNKTNGTYNLTISSLTLGCSSTADLFRVTSLSNVTVTSGCTSLARDTFHDSTFVEQTSLTLPSVETIGNYVFQNVVGLKDLHIGTRFKSLGQGAIDNSDLQNMTLDNTNNISITVSNRTADYLPSDADNFKIWVTTQYFNGYGQNDFSGDWFSKLVACDRIVNSWGFNVLPGNTARIVAYTGSDSAVEIPSLLSSVYTVVSVGPNVLRNQSIESIFVPATVTALDADFVDLSLCTNLQSLTVAEENPAFSVDGLVLYNADGTQLLRCLDTYSTSFTMPSQVVTVQDGAFSGCGIATLTLSNIRTVGSGLTSGMTGLKKIVFRSAIPPYLLGEAALGTLPTVSASATTDDTTVKIQVPEGSLRAYANSSSFSRYQYNISEFTLATDENGWQYYTYYSYAEVVGYVGTQTEVVVPDTLDGLPVQVLGDNAIPKKVTSVTLCAGLKSVSQDAFDSAEDLQAILVEAGSGVFSAEAGVLFDSTGSLLIRFPIDCTPNEGDSSLEGTYQLPETVTNISDGAFSGAKNLTTVTRADVATQTLDLPESDSFTFRVINGEAEITSYTGFSPAVKIPSAVSVDGSAYPVTSVSADAFDGCQITSITVPTSVTSLDARGLKNVPGLVYVNIVAGNSVYSSIQGCLFSADGTQFLLYPSGYSYTGATVPDAVTVIADTAFAETDALTGLAITHSGVTGTIPSTITLYVPAELVEEYQTTFPDLTVVEGNLPEE